MSGYFVPDYIEPGYTEGDAPPDVLVGGHYGAWWADKYQKMFERKPEPPTIAEVLEYVEDEPEEAAAVVREVAPKALSPSITIAQIEANSALQRLIAEQIVIAAQLRQIQLQREADEDDIETILLLT